MHTHMRTHKHAHTLAHSLSHTHFLTHTSILTLTDSLTLIAFSASAVISTHFSPAKRAVRCRLNAVDLRGMASAQRLKHSTETQRTTAHYVRWAVCTRPQPSTPCAERHCLSFASSADTGARRQGCDRALRLRARLHTMRVHTMCELGAGQCPPLKACRTLLAASWSSTRRGFGQFWQKTELFSEKMNFSRENHTIKGATVSVLLFCFSQLGERELITVSINFDSRQKTYFGSLLAGLQK